MVTKIKKPINWKRIALVAAAAGTITGISALRSKPIIPKKSTRPPIIAVMEKPEKLNSPPNLTWEDAVKRIEADAKQRVQARDGGAASPPKDKSSRKFTESELAEWLADSEGHQMRSGPAYDGDINVETMRALPLLHRPLYEEINSKFQQEFKKYMEGTPMPWAPRPFQALVRVADDAAKTAGEGYSPRRVFLSELSDRVLRLKMNFAAHHLQSTPYAVVTIGEKVVLTNSEPVPRIVSQTTTHAVTEFWRKQKGPYPR